MDDRVYQVIELIGSSSDSWEKAAENAVTRARIAMVRGRLMFAVAGSPSRGGAG